MFKKRIANIVFYKVPSGADTKKQATIFYSDGSVATVSFDEGIDACEEIVKERHIQTKDAFKEMINRDIVHVVSAQEFRENYSRYVPAKIDLDMEDNKDKVASNETVVEDTKDEDKDVADITEDEEVVEDDKKEATPSVTPVVGAAIPVSHKDEVKEESEEAKDVYTFDDEEEVEEDKDDKDHFDGEEDFDEDVDTDSFEEDVEEEKKPGIFRRAWNKIKSNKLIKSVILVVTALAVACGIYSCAQRKSLVGEMNRSNLTSITNTVDNTDEDATVIFVDDEDLVQSHFYDDAAISALLNRTNNKTQKTAMTHLGEAMDGFNNTFSAYYNEEGLDVRPALKFDEVVALQVAYNDYSKDQLKAYFNGADIRSEDLQRAYKDASLQLMGAYAIENSEHPVDMSMLLETEEGKAFYQRYHEAFLAAKEATGDEKIRLVTDFYKMVREDFPISQEVRTEGISHAQNYEELEAYKLSVTPMIAAGEMMWQNLNIDVTLQDGEIDFLNDLGLCNYADKTFERAELIALTSEVDKTNPTFQEYKDAFVNYYISHGIYYIDDEHRELTKLQSFQDAVNWHFDQEGEWSYQGETYTTTDTHTETHTWNETETTYHEETTSRQVDESEVPADVRQELQSQVDADIERQNEEARRAAEAAAEAERQRLQREADEQAKRVEEEVRQDAQDLQNNINQANETINNNNSDNNPSNDTPVNESDLGHGVDFDDEHSDSNGNLDSSVENITTDPTGDKTNEPLPDPNETGRDFDAEGEANANAYVAPAASVETSSNNDQWVESVPVDDDYYYEDAWVEDEEDVDYSDAVDAYVESLAEDNNSEEDSYQYQK